MRDYREMIMFISLYNKFSNILQSIIYHRHRNKSKATNLIFLKLDTNTTATGSAFARPANNIPWRLLIEKRRTGCTVMKIYEIGAENCVTPLYGHLIEIK